MLYLLIVVVLLQAYAIIRLSWNARLGIWSRNCLDVCVPFINLLLKWNVVDVVFFDIDNLHERNAQYGWSNVDVALKEVTSSRRTSDVIMQRSGDEIFAFVPKGQGKGFAKRMQKQFYTFGVQSHIILSATYCVSNCIDLALDGVNNAKALDKRNTINCTY